MIELIKKDFLFTAKWCLFSFLYSIFVIVFVGIDGENKVNFLDFLIPFFSVSIPLGKLLLVEDNKNNQNFLKVLPYTAKEKVLARYSFILILLAISQAIVVIAKIFIFNVDHMSVYGIVIETLIFCLYYSVELFIYYWKGYLVSRYSYFVWMLVGFIYMFAAEKGKINIPLLMQEYEKLLPVFLFILLVIIYYFTIKMKSLRREKN